MLLYMVRLSSKDRRPSSLSLPLYEVALRPDNPPLDPSQAAPCQLLSRVTRLQWHTPHVVEHIACRVSQKFSHFCSGMSDRSVTTYLTLLREQHFCRQYRSWRLGDQALTLVGLLRWHLTSRNSRHWELSSESNAIASWRSRSRVYQSHCLS